ncbi:MAG: DNA primase [Methylococcaceae bacterium]|nr:DNA primase [Methylococcaceae bacterium]MCI0667435.1 DNA primase [Methylococcaceae bacterium]MCI0734477.1 DNA primase [Methylococcaceae bacterium]
MARVDIVDVIDSRVPLKQSGRNHIARCPFHQEKTPSFTVNREKQLYHCFGCGAGGTAIGFLMDYAHLDFVEAVEDLAGLVGLEVPRSDPEGRTSAESQKLDVLYDLQKQVAEFYAHKLFDLDSGREAVRYLRRRGVDGGTARKFLLGFAPPGWDVLRERFSVEALNETGLTVRKENGQPYDRFRNRIIFPIRDRRGRVVGFGGRVLDDSLPKYLNSPETVLFEKSKQLYGLYELLSSKPHPHRILVVEGYMDVIALAQHGIRNAVATLGTAVSRSHLDLLFRYARELVFCFDGDQAGKQAAWRAVEIALPALTEGRTLRIMLLPEADDPDSLVRRDGREGFERSVAEATLLSDYFFNYLSTGLNLGELEGCANLVAKARPLIGRLPSGVFREMMEVRLRELARLENVEINDLGRSVDRKRFNRAAVRGRKKSSPIRLALTLIMQHPPLVGLIDSADRRLQEASSAGIRLLLEVADMIKQQPRITPGGLLERFRGTPEEISIRKLAETELIVPVEGIEAEFRGALSRILEQENEKRIEHLLEKAESASLSGQEREELRLLLPSWGGLH